jgi:hypothetical protein
MASISSTPSASAVSKVFSLIPAPCKVAPVYYRLSPDQHGCNQQPSCIVAQIDSADPHVPNCRPTVYNCPSANLQYRRPVRTLVPRHCTNTHLWCCPPWSRCCLVAPVIIKRLVPSIQSYYPTQAISSELSCQPPLTSQSRVDPRHWSPTRTA